MGNGAGEEAWQYAIVRRIGARAQRRKGLLKIVFAVEPLSH